MTLKNVPTIMYYCNINLLLIGRKHNQRQEKIDRRSLTF